MVAGPVGIRRKPRTRVGTLLLGLSVGCTIGFLMSSLTRSASISSSSSSTDSSSLLRSLKTSKQSNNDPEGWHSIHVFYGEKSGLKADPNQQWFAQVHQDQAVVDLLGDNGYFIDLAANDAKEWTNTLALERHGWNGLCIEPNPTYWYGLSHRKCTLVGALVGATKEKVEVQFRGVYGGIVGKMDNKLANRKKEPQAPKEERYTVPLSKVFELYGVPPVIDYLSLDVEGAEYLIMKDFPFQQYQIKVMTVERPTQPLRKLLEEKGFVFLKDLAWWGETLWAHKSTGLTPQDPRIVKIETEERN